jgi:hypothetical protein
MLMAMTGETVKKTPGALVVGGGDIAGGLWAVGHQTFPRHGQLDLQRA